MCTHIERRIGTGRALNIHCRMGTYGFILTHKCALSETSTYSYIDHRIRNVVGCMSRMSWTLKNRQEEEEQQQQHLIWCSNMVGLTICYEVYRLFWGTWFQCVFYVFYACFMCTSLVYWSWLRPSIVDPQGWIEWGWMEIWVSCWQNKIYNK